MQDKILFIDTETGGLNPLQHPLLSIGLVVWEDFELTSSKEILIFEEGLTPDNRALDINKIDINDHRKKALSPKEAINEIKTFLRKNFELDNKVTLAGHNINFDVNFLRFFLDRNNDDFGRYFSHRFIDTSSILYFLYLSGKLKEKAVSSDRAFDLFGINFNQENRHTALADAIATAQLFNNLLKTVAKKINLQAKETGQIDLFTNLL
ncbi:3'-5' exonuclease [Echinicola marina]|uniref:3'-5' exonuclease n=1 Tax=Echinicola marina TaxID=2859768 RepID=UPI001CF6878F|nr:3'-5' exonuclease [Echinicola marina]UCS93954.1 3'-5' exonuclease [Echinicola marina]